MTYDLIYEDEQILVVTKPAGLLTIPDRAGNKDSLIAALQLKYGKIVRFDEYTRELH